MQKLRVLFPYVESETTLYLAQLNNVLFWTEDQAKAEIFVINRASTPTSNEGIEAESAVKVIAGNGTVNRTGCSWSDCNDRYRIR